MPANVRTLFFARAFAMCAMPLMIFSAALATRGFAQSQEWTTLPVAVLVIGMAMSVYPAVGNGATVCGNAWIGSELESKNQ